MIIHYLKISLRNLWKYKTHSLISALCLAVGIVCYILVSMYCQKMEVDLPDMYNPQIQISAESGTKRSIFRQKNKTKRSKKRLRTTLIKSEQKVNETSVPALYFRKNTFRMAF